MKEIFFCGLQGSRVMKKITVVGYPKGGKIED
jgi:hypothetical protein